MSHSLIRIKNPLLPLHHFIELEDIAFHDGHISFKVNTTIFSRFDFVNIERTNFQIHHLS